MRTNRTSIILIALATLIFAGCRTAQVMNVNNAPVIPSNELTNEQMTNAIVRAGQSLGWAMKPVEPGHIVATLYIRDHVAAVDITYNPEEFDITYKSSTNLKYDGTKIHSNYNGWITNLRNAIVTQLNNASTS